MPKRKKTPIVRTPSSDPRIAAAEKLHELASRAKSDALSNALERVAEKLTHEGVAFATERLTEAEKRLLRVLKLE